jgi:hypothetical protein
MVDPRVLDVIAELLQSPDAKVREGTVDICQSLATHDFAFKLFLNASLLSRLLFILRRVQFLIFELGADGRTATQSTILSFVWYTPSLPLRNLAKAHKL